MHNKIGSYARAIGGLLFLSSLSISSIAFAQTFPGMAENTKPPLQIVAGIVGLTVDWASIAPGKRLIVRVLASRRGNP